MYPKIFNDQATTQNKSFAMKDYLGCFISNLWQWLCAALIEFHERGRELMYIFKYVLSGDENIDIQFDLFENISKTGWPWSYFIKADSEARSNKTIGVLSILFTTFHMSSYLILCVADRDNDRVNHYLANNFRYTTNNKFGVIIFFCAATFSATLQSHCVTLMNSPDHYRWLNHFKYLRDETLGSRIGNSKVNYFRRRVVIAFYGALISSHWLAILIALQSFLSLVTKYSLLENVFVNIPWILIRYILFVKGGTGYSFTAFFLYSVVLYLRLRIDHVNDNIRILTSSRPKKRSFTVTKILKVHADIIDELRNVNLYFYRVLFYHLSFTSNSFYLSLYESLFGSNSVVTRVTICTGMAITLTFTFFLFTLNGGLHKKVHTYILPIYQ